MKMKSKLKGASSGRPLLRALVVGSLTLFLGANVNAGVTDAASKHNLTSAGSAQQTTGDTGEVCVFCHTPHGADTAASVPLWNKNLNSGTYQRYSALGTVTLDGAEAPIGSVSLACLSCHDGTQAMDVMINKPGSGGYTAGGAELSAGDIGIMTGAPLPMLGEDLRNDHPISIQYAGGGCTSASGIDCASATFGDADFNTPESATINGNPVWWLDTDANGTRQKTDIFLYTRSDVDGSTIEPTVECGSCHDPHNKESGDTANTVQFLRTSDNNTSKICTACHTK